MKEAFEQVVLAMFNYMTELEFVEIDPEVSVELEVDGNSLVLLMLSLILNIRTRFGEFTLQFYERVSFQLLHRVYRL